MKLALAAMVLAPLLSTGAAVAGSMAFPSSGIVAVLLSSIALYSTLVGSPFLSRRHGSGSIRKDLGLIVERGDVLVVVGYALAARLAIVIVSIALYSIYRPLARGNLEGVDLRRDVAASVALTVMAVGVAPVCEELFFRGLLLRALSSVMTRGAALGGQALLFGVMHVGAYGNVGVVLSTAVVGFVLGHVAERQGRLGAAVLIHAIHWASR